jgi:hypothetical protein
LLDYLNRRGILVDKQTETELDEAKKQRNATARKPKAA